MAITVQVSESNGAGEAVTDNISTGHYGTTDAANIAAATTYPIGQSANSYEKYQRIKWSSGTGSLVQTVKHWRSAGTPGADQSHLCSLSEVTPSDETYAQPVNTTSSKAVNAMPTSEPTGENVDSASMTSSGTYSGYVVKQVQIGATATEGNTGGQETWQWEEVA